MKRHGIGYKFAAGLCCAMIFFAPVMAFCESKKFVDSNEYKDKDFKKCNISDYSDMSEGDDINWLWTEPGIKLSQYKLAVGNVENKSDMRNKSMVGSVKSTFKNAFDDLQINGDSGTLTADICIYDAQNFNAGKAWIPFVGGNQMQAGIGVEMVLHDKNNRTVAKFRHFAREGTQIDNATQELVDDLLKYIGKH